MSVAHRGHLRLSATLALTALAFTFQVPSVVATESDPVVFGDPDLAACVRSALGLSPGTTVTTPMVSEFVELDCSGGAEIDSLLGLEHATALVALDVTGVLAVSPIGSTFVERQNNTAPLLDPLRGLPALEELYIHDPDVSGLLDLGVLGTLPSLLAFETFAVRDGDLTPVAAARNLEWLSIEHGQTITGIEPLSGLTALWGLEIHRLAATDLTPVAQLQQLAYLALPFARSTSLPTMESPSSLVFLDLASSWISDLGDLSETPVMVLDISSTDVVSLEALARTSTLEALYADGIGIEDVSSLAGLLALEEVTLDGNRIRDVSPLAQLPNLDHWTAWDQAPLLGPIETCTPMSVSVGTDFDGSMVSLTSTRGIGVANERLFPFSGTARLVGESTTNPFSISSQVAVTGSSAPCAWPSGWLPEVSYDLTGTVDLPSTVTVSTTGPDPLPVSQFWWRDAVSGSTLGSGESYTPSDFQRGMSVYPEVRFSATGMDTATVTGPVMTVKGVLPASPGVNFVNPPVTGTDALLDLYAMPVNATEQCTWLLSGTVVKTSSCTYRIPTSARGKKLSVSVTVTAPDYHPRTYTTSATVLGELGTVVTPGLINKGATSRTVNVGSTLTATPPTYRGHTVSTKYQWLRNGIPIDGATAKTYKVTKADAGATITARFVASKAGYHTSTTPSLQGISVRKVFTSAPTPTISGTPTAGTTLTAQRGTWSPAASAKYRWYRNGAAISGATSASYKTTSRDLDKKITVRVTASKSGYTTTSKTSAPVTVVRKFTSAPTPTVSGTPRVGSTLTAKAGTWRPSAVTLRYQWYRNGSAIPGATTRTHVPEPGDAYASFSVRVTAKKSGYYTTSKTSKPVTAAGRAYSDCTALEVHYPGGVAEFSTTVDMIDGAPGESITDQTHVSAPLYALNAALDEDLDGWVCEP